MNFGFSEEQEFLRTTAREFLAKECAMPVVRELMDDPARVDEILAAGAERIRPLAEATMAEVREKMGLR